MIPHQYIPNVHTKYTRMFIIFGTIIIFKINAMYHHYIANVPNVHTKYTIDSIFGTSTSGENTPNISIWKAPYSMGKSAWYPADFPNKTNPLNHHKSSIFPLSHDYPSIFPWLSRDYPKFLQISPALNRVRSWMIGFGRAASQRRGHPVCLASSPRRVGAGEHLVNM